jgi:hypothetical protein
MSKNKNKTKEKASKPESAGPLSGQSRFVELIAGGDFRAARAQARKLLADPAAPEADKAAAAEVLGRLKVDTATLTVGIIGFAVLSAIATLVLH